MITGSVHVQLTLFLIGITLRDLAYFYWFRYSIEPLEYAAINVTVVFIAAALRSPTQNASAIASMARTASKRESIAAILLSLICAYTYTFFWSLSRISPGVFNLVDYGLTPLLTVLVGVAMFGERMRRVQLISAAIFLGGIITLFRSTFIDTAGLALATTYPFATVASDAISKVLVTKWSGAADSTLIVRFGLASPILLVASLLSGWRVPGLELLAAIACAVLFAYVPLRSLMTALESGSLQQLAVYEMMIPILSLVGSLPAVWRRVDESALVGIVAIVAAISFNFFGSRQASV